MHPILLQWGNIILPAWHFFYVVGAIAGFFVFQYLLKQSSSLSELDGSRIFAICYISGYFGARALSIAIEEPEHHTLGAFFVALFNFGSMTFYGGALLGFLGGFAYLLLRRLSVGEAFDSAIPAFLVGLGFGRIGCFLNGDDFGTPLRGMYESPPWWSVTFPNLADGIARYPVQLWEAGFGLLLGMILMVSHRYIRKFLRAGGVGVIGSFAYAVFRFWNEYYRGDDRKWLIDGRISTSQAISTAVILLLIGLAPIWLRSPYAKVRRSSNG